MFPVLKDDNGIRPAGKPDECFYCHGRVGEMHGSECVIINRMSTYGVYVAGQRIGEWKRPDPAHWNEHDCNFHKNDSSWCINNMLSSGVYEGEPLIEPEDGCLCHVVTLKLEDRGEQCFRSED